MSLTARRHNLPAALVAADAPLSADVTGRSWEALAYLWQVCTGTADALGAALPAPEGHTHDGVRDQTLTADAQPILGAVVGAMAPVQDGNSGATWASHALPGGGWVSGSTVTLLRGIVHAPYSVTGPVGSNATLRAYALVEKGAAVTGAPAPTVTVTIDGAPLAAATANPAAGLELVPVGDWPAGTLTGGGPLAAHVDLNVQSLDIARLWSVVVVPV